MENHDVKQVEQRVKRYWYSDGIAELASGGLFVLLGLYFWIQVIFGEESIISVFLQVILVLVMIAGFIGVRWLVNTLKARLTYPRTGYVEYRVNDREVRQRRWIIVAAAAIVSGVSIVLEEYVHGLDSMVLLIGFLAGIIFIALRGRSSGLKRFYALGGLSIVLGIALSFSSLSQITDLALFFGLLGIVIVTSGALVLRQYLEENPLPAENSNG
jgi:hypothetical protein